MFSRSSKKFYGWNVKMQYWLNEILMIGYNYHIKPGFSFSKKTTLWCWWMIVQREGKDMLDYRYLAITSGFSRLISIAYIINQDPISIRVWS